MTDREFLMWTHERLEHIHGENPLMDYMHKLRAIIHATPASRETPNVMSCSSLKELRKRLERRVPVQGEFHRGANWRFNPGTISWGEHAEAYTEYAKRHGTSQTAERIAERGGFGYSELVKLLGHSPKTWTPHDGELQYTWPVAEEVEAEDDKS